MPRLSVLLFLVSTMSLPCTPESPRALSDIPAYRLIDNRLATSGQIAYDDITAIQAAGYDMVVNLAPADKDRNGEEGFRVVEQGMAYMHIPVSWENPSLRDLDLFLDFMTQNRDRKVFVHCFANMRVSTFVYLFRTLKEGVPEEEARKDLLAVWDPASLAQWHSFVERARTEFGPPAR